DTGSRMLLFSSPGFDASIWNWWWGWARGRAWWQRRPGSCWRGQGWLGWGAGGGGRTRRGRRRGVGGGGGGGGGGRGGRRAGRAVGGGGAVHQRLRAAGGNGVRVDVRAAGGRRETRYRHSACQCPGVRAG